MLLSILIPTVTGRSKQFTALCEFLHNIIDLHDLDGIVEVVFLRDNKEMTIGEKREKLYRMATGLFSWQIDDDDCVPADAIPIILEAIKEMPSCITYEELCNIDGIESRSNFSLKYADWAENEDGFDHVRTPFFKTPILTSICQQVPIPHIRFGEDHVFARAVKTHLHAEVHIDKVLYYYNHVSSPFNERYGITEE